MLKNPSYEKWKPPGAKIAIARKALSTLSKNLQEQLCCGLRVKDKTCFDVALNRLSMDDRTRDDLVQEVKRDAPLIKAVDATHLATRCFRRKVNTLRSIGKKVLVSLLDELCPGWQDVETSTDGDVIDSSCVRKVRGKTQKEKKAERRAAKQAAAGESSKKHVEAGAIVVQDPAAERIRESCDSEQVAKRAAEAAENEPASKFVCK